MTEKAATPTRPKKPLPPVPDALNVSGSLEEKLNKYREDGLDRNTGYALANALRPKRDGTLFEHFIVVGVDPNIKTGKITPKTPVKHEPKVLYQYPPDKKLGIEYVAHFCFPHSIEVSAVERTKSASSRNEILFGQLSRVEQNDCSYIFLITAEHHLLYGVCVSYNELLTDYSSFVEPSENHLETRAVYDYVAPRCYCLLSKFPFFRLHFEVLYAVIARERLTKIAIVTGVSEQELKLEKNNNTLDLLISYNEKQVPNAENRSLTFNLPGELRSLEFVCPPGDEDKQLADWGIATTFLALKLEHILDLFRAAMLEKSIVVVCSNLGLLSSVILSIIPILRPYVFQGPFIPILPSVLYEYLDAPVPFIIGVKDLPNYDPAFVQRLKQEKVILYVEENKITFPSGVPPLPEQKQLYETLKPHYDKVNEKGKKPITIRSQDQYLTDVSAIVQSFKSYHAWLMDDIIIHHIKLENNTFDWSNTDKLNELVNSMPANLRSFMKEFVASQQFNIYGDKLLQIIKAKPVLSTERKKGHKSKKANLSVGDVDDFRPKAAAVKKLSNLNLNASLEMDDGGKIVQS